MTVESSPAAASGAPVSTDRSDIIVRCQCLCGDPEGKGFPGANGVLSLFAPYRLRVTFSRASTTGTYAALELRYHCQVARGGKRWFAGCQWNDNSTPAFFPSAESKGAGSDTDMRERGLAARAWADGWGLSTGDRVYLFCVGLLMLAWLGVASCLPTTTAAAHPLAATSYLSQLLQGAWRQVSKMPGAVHHVGINRRLLLEPSRRLLQSSPASSSNSSPSTQQQQQQQQQAGQGLPEVNIKGDVSWKMHG
jgi:hypothetical protein